MVDRSVIQKQLQHTFDGIDLSGLGPKISGKVRDSYVVGDKRVLVTSDRLSAFDRVLTTIPFKGQLLNQMAAYWFSSTQHIVQNHIIYHPHPNVFIAQQAQILPIEVVIRGYLTGSAWRDYTAGKDISGINLPKGMRRSERFENPLITPSTKAEAGFHDEPISSEEIISKGIVEKKIWEEVCETALKLFAFGTKKAAEHGLILVDTKYEFGLVKQPNGSQKLILADEIHTQDSSRYWLSDGYDQAFEQGQDPNMLDKEFVRRWLMEQGYMGEGTPPQFTDEFRVQTAEKYIAAFEQITGCSFYPKIGSVEAEIKEAVEQSLK